MEFFNKKEEVLDVQLTEYGKYLLSQGRMKPAYYAFYDDEILYDISASADSGVETLTEAQKGCDRRIRYETPNLKPQANTTGVETRVRQFQKAVESNVRKKALTVNSINFADAYESVPQFGAKFFAASDPLGTSDPKSQYDAAWGITLLNNEISSSTDYYTVNLTSSAATLNNGVIKEIPQLDIVVDYQTFYVQGADQPNNTNRYDILTKANQKGINVALDKNYLLIDLQEHNTLYEKENFYYEVYLSSSDTGLTLLCPDTQIPPGVPADLGDGAALEDDGLSLDALRSTVSYFLDITVDAEIELDIAREHGIKRRQITHNEGLLPDPQIGRRGPVRDPDGTPRDRFNPGDDPIDIYSFPFDTGEDEEPCD